MPPKLPKRKSKKHAEGCFCEKCLAKREVSKKQPVHVRFSKDLESEDEVPHVPCESFILQPQKSNKYGKEDIGIKNKERSRNISSRKKSNKLRTLAYNLCVLCKLEGRASVYVDFCGKCLAAQEDERKRVAEGELACGRNEADQVQKYTKELENFQSELSDLPFLPCSLRYATKKYYGKIGLSRKKGGLVSKDKRDFFVENFSDILKIHKDMDGQWLCCRNRADKVDMKMMDLYCRIRLSRKSQEKLVTAESAELPTRTLTNTSIARTRTESVSSSTQTGDCQSANGFEELPIQNIKQEVLSDDDLEEVQVKNRQRDSEYVSEDCESQGEKLRTDLGQNIKKASAQNIIVDTRPVVAEEVVGEEDKPVEHPKVTSCSDSDVESLLIPPKRKKLNNVVLDDSDEDTRVTSKRIKLKKVAAVNVFNISPTVDKPRPRSARKKIKPKSKTSNPKPAASVRGGDDSETDLDFLPTSSSSESSDSESVYSSSLAEDEDAVQIVSDTENENINQATASCHLRIQPMVVLETIAELEAKVKAKNSATQEWRKMERKREDFEDEVLADIEFSRCSLNHAIDVLVKTMNWDVFPFGAKVLNRGKITKTQVESPNAGEWLRIKEQFMVRHFKTALSITPCRGKWYCCRNRVDKLDFKVYLSRFWNIQ